MDIGSCSWKYPEWKGMVYSGETENLLEEYSRKFSSVEVDQWFWSLFSDTPVLPDPLVVRSYADSTPENFRFSIKLPDSLSLTHYRPAGKGANNAKAGKGGGTPSSTLRINPWFLSRELLEKVLLNLGPILPRTSVLMLQFEYLNRRKMPDRESFFAVLEDFFSSLPVETRGEHGPHFGVEIRNPQYYGKEFFSLLASFNIAPVLTHGYYLPPVWETVRENLDSFSPRAPMVLRLHGPDRRDMDRLSGGKWGRIIRHMDPDIARVVESVHLLEGRGIETIINVNNHFEGSAPLSIAKLLEQL